MLQHERKAKRLAIKRISDYQLKLIHNRNEASSDKLELADELIQALQKLLDKMRKELIK